MRRGIATVVRQAQRCTYSRHRAISTTQHLHQGEETAAKRTFVAKEVTPKQLDISPNEVKARQNQLISHLDLLRKQRRWEEAPGCIRRAKAQGLYLSDEVYGMAIKVMTFSGQWERALDIMAGLRAEARHPDLSGANSALAACMKANQWEKALELLQDMKDLGPQPNTLSFNNVIGACCRAGKPEEALMVIQQMKLSKGKLPRPDVVGLSTAVDALTGNWERAVSLLKQLQEAGNTPQAISYMDTISVCGSSGQWARAVALLEEMKEKGLKPNVGCYTDLIRASIEENELGKVKALLEEMMERGVQPNRELDRLVSHSSGDIDSYREWHEISNLVQTMRGGKATTASA